MASSIEKTLFLSAKMNLSSFFCEDSLVTEAVKSPLVKYSVDNLTKIYCVARSNSSFKLALDFTKYVANQLCSKTNARLMQNCGVQLQAVKLNDNVHVLGEKELTWEDLGLKNKNAYMTHTNLFDFGRRLLEDVLLENAPESLQEWELMKFLKSTLGIPKEGYSKSVDSPRSDSVEESLSGVLWHVAEKHWKETTEKLSLYSPERAIHSVVEQLQDRIREVVVNNSLVLQMIEAGTFFTATTLSLKHEAEELSQALSESTEHAIAGVTGFWKDCSQNPFTLKVLYNTLYQHVLGFFLFEGIELFSQYIWTTKPDLDLPELMDMNFVRVEEDDFHFVVEERMPRRSILFIGVR